MKEAKTDWTGIKQLPKHTPYLQAANRELSQQIALLKQYLQLRQHQLKAVFHKNEGLSPDPLLDLLDDYALVEAKWLNQLHFFYQRQNEWERSCPIKLIKEELKEKEAIKAELLGQLQRMTALFDRSLREVSHHFNKTAQKIQFSHHHRRFNPSFYDETAAFLDIQG